MLAPPYAVATLLAVMAGAARGAEPAGVDTLDALVAVALERHPEAAALDLDADAARARATASGRPMDIQWMVGAEALGVMPGSSDQTMYMFGVEQMIALPPAYRASRDRASLDVRWAEGERAQIAADVKQYLWESAARLRAQTEEAHALDEQIAAAEAALAFGRARYSTGSRAPGPAPGSASATSPPEAAPPPRIKTPRSVGTKGSGMSGMNAMPGAAAGVEVMVEGGDMAAMGAGMPATMPTPMGGEGLASLLRLDAELARTRADRDALRARLSGEQARLSLIVGDDAALAVIADPARFLGVLGASLLQPERTLAAAALEMAEADTRVARTARLPIFMVGADVRVMPEGMVAGVDAWLGVTLPLWGGAAARVEAADLATAAASRRSELVGRSLAEAIVVARSDEAAAVIRSRSLTDVAIPHASAAWDATVAVWAAGGGSGADLVAVWQTQVGILRDATAAELAVELARARLARLEGT